MLLLFTYYVYLSPWTRRQVGGPPASLRMALLLGRGSEMTTVIFLLLLALIGEGNGPRGARGMMNGVGRLPVMGWNSWNSLRCEFDEGVLREVRERENPSGGSSRDWDRSSQILMSLLTCLAGVVCGGAGRLLMQW